MRRLRLFLGALSWGGRLQVLAVAIILGWWIWLDVHRGHWPVTIGIVLFSLLIGWLMKSTMATHPRATTRILSAVGIALLMLYLVVGNQKWWRLLISHFARELLLWLEFSCEYWFVSEVKLRQERQANDQRLEQYGKNKIDHGDRFDFRNDDFGDLPT